MSLMRNRVLRSIHPWLAARMKVLGDAIEFYRGVQTYVSGLRSFEQQEALFNRRGTRPVAAPGCSQHQYAFAVDVAWGLLREDSPVGHFSPSELNDLMSGWGRQLGLVTVVGDPGHFQVFPGAEFKNWAVASGFCSPPPPVDRIRMQYVDCLGDARSRSAFNTPLRDALVSRCYRAFAVKDLARASQEQGFTVRGPLF